VLVVNAVVSDDGLIPDSLAREHLAQELSERTGLHMRQARKIGMEIALSSCAIGSFDLQDVLPAARGRLENGSELLL
jgi:hypothetical protein